MGDKMSIFKKCTCCAIPWFTRDEFLQDAISVRNKITPATKRYLSKGGHFGEFEAAVKNHMDSGARIVILGHTHRCQLKAIGRGIYGNFGAWLDSVDPAYIAFYKGRVDLKQALNHKLIEKISFD